MPISALSSPRQRTLKTMNCTLLTSLYAPMRMSKLRNAPVSTAVGSWCVNVIIHNSLNPKMYSAALKTCAKYTEIPIAPPTSKPSVFLMILYTPPRPMRIFVVMLPSDSPVDAVTETARRTISKVVSTPALPTMYPRRKKKITPMMGMKVGMNTPKKLPSCCLLSLIYVFFFADVFICVG